MRCWPLERAGMAAKASKKIFNCRKICKHLCCSCGCGSHLPTKRQAHVIIKHYKSQFFKETFSDPYTIVCQIRSCWVVSKSFVTNPPKSTRKRQKMLYFWLTSAVHQANRAAMESVDQLSQIKRKKKSKNHRKKKNSSNYSSEADLTGLQPLNRPRSDSQATVSNASLSSSSL